MSQGRKIRRSTEGTAAAAFINRPRRESPSSDGIDGGGSLFERLAASTTDRSLAAHRTPSIQPFPLIDFTMPLAYQWACAFLADDMFLPARNSAPGGHESERSGRIEPMRSIAFALGSGFGSSSDQVSIER